MSNRCVRREVVTVVRQTVLNGAVVSANTQVGMRNVYAVESQGYEYVMVDKKRVQLIRGVALTGGVSDPMGKVAKKQ